MTAPTHPARAKRRASGSVLGTLGLCAFLLLWAFSVHPWITSLAVTGAAGSAVWYVVVRVQRRRAVGLTPWRGLDGVQPLRMDADDFEEFLAALCRRDGCTDVRVVGGANDHGADVLYRDPHGRPGLIQAKRYAPGRSVGNEHVQIVNGTYRDAHHCTHASIVTTSHFTKAAREYADHVRIALVDSHRLNAWINGEHAAAPWN